MRFQVTHSTLSTQEIPPVEFPHAFGFPIVNTPMPLEFHNCEPPLPFGNPQSRPWYSMDIFWNRSLWSVKNSVIDSKWPELIIIFIIIIIIILVIITVKITSWLLAGMSVFRSKGATQFMGNKVPLLIIGIIFPGRLSTLNLLYLIVQFINNFIILMV